MKKLLTILLLLVAAVVGLGFALKPAYTVSRHVVIKAEPAKIHAWTGDFAKWDEFMPWKEDDPSIVYTRKGPTSGEGATETWTGENGDGALTITRSDPETGVDFDMVFIHGETRMPSKAGLHYRKVAEGTEVTWDIAGSMEPMGFVGRYFAPLMDRFMVGPMFDRGLQKLKAVVEKG